MVMLIRVTPNGMSSEQYRVLRFGGCRTRTWPSRGCSRTLLRIESATFA